MAYALVKNSTLITLIGLINADFFNHRGHGEDTENAENTGGHCGYSPHCP